MRRRTVVKQHSGGRTPQPYPPLRVTVVWGDASAEESKRLLKEAARIILDAARRTR